MTKRTAISFGLVAGALTVGGAGLATGQVAGGSPAQVQQAVAPLAGRTNFGAPHQTSSSALRAHLERGNPEYLADVDWSSARSFVIPGTSFRGWTFAQPRKRCLAIPDPLVEGYGITCRTPKDIAAGKATVVMLPPTETGAPNIVGVLTTGSETPSIEAPPGSTKHWQRTGDVYAGTVPAGSRLVTASGRHAIDPPKDDILPPSQVPTP